MTEPPTPRKPTDAGPGSPEKVEIMAQRLADGERLHHPDDRSVRIEPREISSHFFRFGDCFEPEQGGGIE